MQLRRILLATLVTLPAAAAEPISGPYVDIGGGASVLQNQEVKPYEGFGPSRKDYTFDTAALVLPVSAMDWAMASVSNLTATTPMITYAA